MLQNALICKSDLSKMECFQQNNWNESTTVQGKKLNVTFGKI